MSNNRCALYNDKIPKHLGVYLGGKLYCNQRHAEIGFMGIIRYQTRNDKNECK